MFNCITVCDQIKSGCTELHHHSVVTAYVGTKGYS